MKWLAETTAHLAAPHELAMRISIEAMSKLENDKRTSIVAPLYEWSRELCHFGLDQRLASGAGKNGWFEAKRRFLGYPHHV
jgi:hypothetical protein